MSADAARKVRATQRDFVLLGVRATNSDLSVPGFNALVALSAGDMPISIILAGKVEG
jgi:hypothetical protein